MSSSFQQQHQEMETSSTSSAPSPCAKGCGFFGSPGTMNMCSVCFRKHLLATATAAVVPSKAEDVVMEKTTAAAPAALTDAEIRKMEAQEWAERVRKAAENPYYANRCKECFKKMAPAMRFECRCGKAYCIKHRNSEDHHCSFDYQRAGRISIRRSNPLIEADKMRDRI